MKQRFSVTLVYMCIVYCCLLAVGFMLCVEKDDSPKSTGLSHIRDSIGYLWKDAMKQRSFYLLFLTRLTAMVIIGGILAHWKTFSLELSSDDQLISVVGGGNGVFSAISRLLAGVLIDRFSYRHVMTLFYSSLCVCMLVMYHISQLSFPGFMLLMWMANLFSFIHFASIPTQTIQLFSPKYNSIVLGGIGFADTVAYTGVALLNYLIFSISISTNPFLCYFLSLSVCSCIAAGSSYFVLEPPKSEAAEKTSNVKNVESSC